MKKPWVPLFSVEKSIETRDACLLQRQAVSPNGRGALHMLHTYLVTTLTSDTPSSQPGVTQ